MVGIPGACPPSGDKVGKGILLPNELWSVHTSSMTNEDWLLRMEQMTTQLVEDTFMHIVIPQVYVPDDRGRTGVRTTQRDSE